MQVALVKNYDPRHHRHKPQALARYYAIRPYTPAMLGLPTEAALFENLVSTVDFSFVKSIVLMYNAKERPQNGSACFVFQTKTILVTLLSSEKTRQGLQKGKA